MSQIISSSISGIWTFVRVVETGTFSAAARDLGVTPSGVSKQIARLENRLGVRLLRRTTRSVRPTEAGMALYQRCRHLFDTFREAEDEVRSIRSDFSGRLHVTATPAFGRLRLVAALGEFARAHPRLRFEVTLTVHRLDLVEAGVDIAIREGDLPDSSLIATKLMESSMLLCASPRYLGSRPPIKTLADLAAHDVLMVPAAQAMFVARRRPRRDGDELEARFLVNDLASLHALAVDGHGVATLPDYMVGDDLRSGTLVPVLRESTARLPRIPIYAVRPDRNYLPAKVGALLDFLANRFAEDGVRG